jgi:hypothetical protein
MDEWPESPYLESEFAELAKLAGEHELPRDVLQAMHHPARRHGTLGLDETQLRERLNQLQELGDYRLRSRIHPPAIRQPITIASAVNICLVERRKEASTARLLKVPPAVNNRATATTPKRARQSQMH